MGQSIYTISVAYPLPDRSQNKWVWHEFDCKGHSVTNAVTRFVTRRLDDGKIVQEREMYFDGPMRLEIFQPDGGVVVFGDIKEIVYRLGEDWQTVLQEEIKRESGGLVAVGAGN